MYRQGDLLIIPVKNIPKTARKQKDRILALGEVTGHSHEMTDGEVYRKDGDKYVTLLKAASLVHQEHGKIDLPAGNYKVLKQREYKPAKRRSVAVMD